MEARDSFCFPKNTKNPNPSPIEKRFGSSILAVVLPVDIPARWEPRTNKSPTGAFVAPPQVGPYGLRLLIFPQPFGRALKNQNAAPTTPPCFCRRQRSSSLLFKFSYPLLQLKGQHHVKQKRQLSKAVFLVVRIRGLEPPPSCPD